MHAIQPIATTIQVAFSDLRGWVVIGFYKYFLMDDLLFA